MEEAKSQHCLSAKGTRARGGEGGCWISRRRREICRQEVVKKKTANDSDLKYKLSTVHFNAHICKATIGCRKRGICCLPNNQKF